MPTEKLTTRTDLNQIHKSIALICGPGQVHELRVLKTRRATVRGYFDDFEKLALAAAAMSGKAPAVYVTPNPVNPALLARGANRLVGYARETTSDPDILFRNWFLIDFDPVRPSGISSTESEHGKAINRAEQTVAWLKQCGWPDPILADSGNGAHLLYRIDLPNDTDAANLLMICLKALSFHFDDDAVKVDTGNFNAARIWKVYGTLVAKGDSIHDRPHRFSCILDTPELLDIAPPPLLHTLAAEAPQQPPVAAYRHYRGKGDPFDLENWIVEHAIPIHHQGTWNGGDKWVLSQCLWNPDHTDNSAFIVRFPNGAIAAGCHHNGCQGRGWAELRKAVQPGYTEQNQGASTYQQARKIRGRIYIPRVEVQG